MLLFTIVIGSCASLIDVIIIMRWNLAIGIPDKVFFLLGNAVLENLIVIMWGVASSASKSQCPISIFAISPNTACNISPCFLYHTVFAKLAPPGLEAAVFGKQVAGTSLLHYLFLASR